MTTHSLKEDNRPSDQWYWDDWFSEFGLRLCSLAARGLWMDMLGIAFKAEIRGTLTVNGHRINGKGLAKILGEDIEYINELLEELEANEVFSRLEDGTIISRRLYKRSKRKEEIARIRSEAGKIGAGKRWGGSDSKPIANSNSKMIAKPSTSSPTPSSSPSPTPKSKAPRNPSGCDACLTLFLIQGIESNKSKQKTPFPYSVDFFKWVDHIRLARERDDCTRAELKAAIIYSQNDDFWRGNILSTASLRKQMPKLILHSKRGTPNRPSQIGRSTTPASPDELMAHKRLLDLRDLREPELRKQYNYTDAEERARKSGSRKELDDIDIKIENDISREYKQGRGL